MPLPGSNSLHFLPLFRAPGGPLAIDDSVAGASVERLPRRTTRFVLMRTTRAWPLPEERAHLLCFRGQTREKAVRSVAVRPPPLDTGPPLPDLTAVDLTTVSRKSCATTPDMPRMRRGVDALCRRRGCMTLALLPATPVRLAEDWSTPYNLSSLQSPYRKLAAPPLCQGVATPFSTEFRDTQPHSASPSFLIANEQKNKSCSSLPQRRPRHGRPG